MISINLCFRQQSSVDGFFDVIGIAIHAGFLRSDMLLCRLFFKTCCSLWLILAKGFKCY